MKPESPLPQPGRWNRIEEICFEAMQLSGDARRRFLSSRCGDDRALHLEVEELLHAADTRPDFLERPVVRVTGHAGLMETDGTPPVERVGPFRVVRPLGHGGMGDVYLAMHEGEGFSRPVALKLIRRGLDTERVLRRFRQERRILAGLGHPNIAALIDGGITADGRSYFVMEYVEGEPIDAFCHRNALPLRSRLELVRTVCSAVHHAHQNLVVHRDIKPANILVTPEGVPKLLDFGIGKVLEDDGTDGGGATRVDERALTPDYAAPEQREGGPITTATDVYGLGVLLYRLVTDRLPYPPAGDAVAGAPSPRDRDPPRPSAVAPADRRVSREVDAIILKALRPEPRERYAGAMALAEDLDRYLRGMPVRARPPSLAYVAGRFVARHRVAVASTAVVLAAILGATVFTWRQSQRVALERDRALEVRGFLLETFGAAGPDRGTGDPVTAKALLDGQAAVVETTYADDPTLRAEMMTVLAEGYERLGLFAEAEAWARRVVETDEGVEPAEAAAALGLLGWVTHQQGRPRDAEPVLRDAVARARVAPAGQRALARALNDLGVVQEALGAYDEAEGSHLEARALRARLFGADDRSVAVSASNLSAIHYRQGDLDLAVREAEEALAIFRRSLGPDHQRTVIVQGNLAVFKLVSGDLAGAVADYRDLLDRQTRLQGRAHPVTVRVMISLASVLRRVEQWDEAESLLRETLEIEGARPEPNPVDVAFTAATLGDVLSNAGQHGVAVDLLHDALRAQTDALGPDHVDVAQTQSYLSRAYQRVDSLGQAVTWQKEAVETLRGSLGPGHAQTQAEEARLRELHEALDGRVGGGI